MKTSALILLTLATSLTLVGCSRENPLSSLEPSQIAQDVFKVAVAAEQKQGEAKGMGYGYQYCIEDAAAAKMININCDKLVTSMLKELRQKSVYKRLKKYDITGEQVKHLFLPEYRHQQQSATSTRSYR